VKVVVLAPFRDAAGRGDLWRWVRKWIARSYDFPVFTADAGGDQFSIGASRNLAARDAGNWDVALFHDVDTIAHPDAVRMAVDMAWSSDKMIVAADAHMYCDRPSSARIMASGSAAFARPASFDDKGIYARPSGGVLAVNRRVFEAVGGYMELTGYGYEDLVFLQSCGLFAGGYDWVPGHITLHLWHEPSKHTADTRRNRQIWQNLANYRRLRNPAGARKYLAGFGHVVP
jgi:hypothetical protein